MSTKTPLQAVVGVICDCLAELSADDQARALDAARVTLGLRAPRTVQDFNPYRDQVTREPLPLVEVQMINDRPVVGPRQTAIIQPRQLPAPSAPPTTAQSQRGYVRPLR